MTSSLLSFYQTHDICLTNLFSGLITGKEPGIQQALNKCWLLPQCSPAAYPSFTKHTMLHTQLITSFPAQMPTSLLMPIVLLRIPFSALVGSYSTFKTQQKISALESLIKPPVFSPTPVSCHLAPHSCTFYTALILFTHWSLSP